MIDPFAISFGQGLVGVDALTGPVFFALLENGAGLTGY